MRSWVTVSAFLILLGSSLFLYKWLGRGYPLTLSGLGSTWRAELIVNLNGDGKRVVAEALLPRTSGYQRILSEEVRSGPLRFSIAEEDSGRVGHWSGKLSGSQSVSYQVTFDALAYAAPLPKSDDRREYPKSVQVHLGESPGIEKDAPAIADLASELSLDPNDHPATARHIFEFVHSEIGSLRSSGEMDAVSVVREGRGNPLGRARLFCALARAQGMPCRVVPGLRLDSGTHDALHYWNEAWVSGDWVPFDTVDGLAERLPADRLALSTGAAAVVAKGTTTMSFRFEVDSELAAYSDLMRQRLVDSRNIVDRASLLFLPVSVQGVLRLLLLVPLGALAMSVLRGMVGLRTFGMFMPMLLALAFTSTGLLWGTAILASVVSVALLSRILIQRLYLLLVSRIAFILTMVILLMIALMAIGDRYNLPTTGVGAFPFVIMTMIVERISVSLEEEGVRNTLSRVASTIISVYLTYAVIQAKFLGSFLLVFPELLIVIMGFQIAVGRYTGYRLTELFRFRGLAVE